ncbi:UDP-N-acetylglucosamine-N-acetylmuramylpentapeptide N-acetylglucosamine transferase [Nonlabens xylanidelens]|uniref:UDP-N-acetylglucosamine--N-acetylmuramyl-(pentapeptide) pyrophosphoryl-undecaprenol N-acetylglucosamine transferase n=1 Tax=Nonlabens xylanidelens TaxID=191564 RepID=A0A2S6IJU3_9FLAO|nr:undecaprenyldiphospho-muramoylpentapeptide beta-N-acetylglucosaminyltransferase [Nonlabens xylanidelens]PPK94445.1 UDP-N-acetylglucosamine-N-acetylmuramylpentapeptide N-acetylglucosamine transferase [Nonlabens xylanidelens]PQJ21396.1 undecaprenyldiphospho-muramoylpentapeptide beta-N-acetylglucosaminyltransferase [Nonlabens xylanidelens]
MKPFKIIISGGGTGGHIYPAISIANECRRRWADCEILFVGASDRMEMEKVPAAGYDIKGLWISGIQRSLSLKNLAFPLKVIKSLYDAGKIIKSFQPDIAIGTGGFASGPLLFMANKKGIPTLIQEQNSYPGITNKLLSKKVNKICVASTGLERFFPKEKIVLTGNPVRQDLLNVDSLRAEALSHYNLDASKKTLLVLGGSLGARRVNQLIDSNLELFTKENVQVIWQCGKFYYQEYKEKAQPGIQVHAFLNRMDLAYAAADFIISRAGAGSISELCIVGKPVVFIPSPHVAEDHQTKNAQAITAQDAALMIKEVDLDQNFKTLWTGLLSNIELQKKLSENIKKQALPDATKTIVNELEQLLK